MRGNIGKGTEVFQFFADFYKYLSEHYEPENSDEYYESLLSESDKLLDKYAKCNFILLAKGLLLVVAVYMSDIKSKGITKGHWSITFKGEKES